MSYRRKFVLIECTRLLAYKIEKDDEKSENRATCNYNTPREPGKVCEFTTDALSSCSPQHTKNTYGFPERKPCIFLKLNKVYNSEENTRQVHHILEYDKTKMKMCCIQIYNWVPDLYNNTETLPKNMPEYLKTAINDISNVYEVRFLLLFVSVSNVLILTFCAYSA